MDKSKRIKIRQCKYLNNIVEQDHRFIKRRIRPMLDFKSFRSARAALVGIELWHMLKKGQNQEFADRLATVLRLGSDKITVPEEQ